MVEFELVFFAAEIVMVTVTIVLINAIMAAVIMAAMMAVMVVVKAIVFELEFELVVDFLVELLVAVPVARAQIGQRAAALNGARSRSCAGAPSALRFGMRDRDGEHVESGDAEEGPESAAAAAAALVVR